MVEVSSLKDEVAFLLKKKNPTYDDILYSLQDLQVNERDFALFLDDEEYELYVESCRSARVYLNEGLHIPTNEIVNFKIYQRKVRDLKKDFLTNAAAEYYKAEITEKVRNLFKSFRHLNLTEQEALDILREKAPEQAKVYAGINVQCLAKINYDPYEEILRNAMIEDSKSKFPLEILSCLLFSTKNWYFPILTLQYEKKGIACVNWIVQIYVVADQEVLANERIFSIEFENQTLGYYEKYFTPEELNIKPIEVFSTPISLLRLPPRAFEVT